MRKILFTLGFMILFAAVCGAEQSEHPCQKDPAYKRLDFWLGKWNVYTPDGKKDGTNFIEKILDGCAVRENWLENDGHQGQSVFYYNPVTQKWKQVWITDVGPMKEKSLIETFPDGGVRFQGEIPTKDGGKYYDRTTLTPMSGKVHQVIEVSRDGETWRTVYDGTYVRP